LAAAARVKAAAAKTSRTRINRAMLVKALFLLRDFGIWNALWGKGRETQLYRGIFGDLVLVVS
jgi:hypothetical protein